MRRVRELRLLMGFMHDEAIHLRNVELDKWVRREEGRIRRNLRKVRRMKKGKQAALAFQHKGKPLQESDVAAARRALQQQRGGGMGMAQRLALRPSAALLSKSPTPVEGSPLENPQRSISVRAAKAWYKGRPPATGARAAAPASGGAAGAARSGRGAGAAATRGPPSRVGGHSEIPEEEETGAGPAFTLWR